MNKLKILILSLLVIVAASFANVPGGGSTGANVTVKDNGTTVVLDNGIVAITVTKASGTIKTWTYNGKNVLTGGNDGGQVYWELEAGNGVYTLEADPATNGGDMAEVRMHMVGSPQDVDIDYALLRGNTGFYATGILSHPASYPAWNGGEWRVNVYVGSTFDWLSVDAKRNKMMCSGADWAAGVAVAGAPKEVLQLTTGIYKGQYECKYSYSADFGEEEAWGWTSSTDSIGIWVTLPSIEYYNGGPKKRELTCQAGPAMLNMFGGSHYGMGNNEVVAAGTAVRKIYGPFFYYLNKAKPGTADFHNVLFNDAIAQSKAEQTAWPYTWFKDTGYVQESARGTVSGTFAITDPGAPNASPVGMWIGLAPDVGDFQQQFFTYEFWVKTGPGGAFTIPHVIPGAYALYAFGPGGPGTFKKTGVTVTAGQTLNLGTVSWTPPRTASTIWEIGYPDRDSHEFLNGDSLYGYWQTAYINYATEFPNGVTYTVGTDKYSKTWNWAIMNAQTWKVNFTLPNAPTGTKGGFYLGLASSDGSRLTFNLNGTQIATINPGSTSDAVVRLGSHGAFWDTSFTFNASALKAGTNTLSIAQSGGTLEWDYLRMEADGTGVPTGINSAPISAALVHHAIFLKSVFLVGDGIHGLDLIGPNGRTLAHSKAGQALNLSGFSYGLYFARCGAEIVPVPWTH
ncbi:MAG: polysaccharide lyase family protein [Chitinivibrionales bacterium]